ncbi:HEXXH motif domain-containing protein [Streptomyces sp. DT2A-34]|uniref:HEXXH motif domain-containing protein n=1 Tax=Streptomyces sp. DT2A-34 TaxID=3051182 RepID=UPI00265BC227|nr:HEXXH motif domain-containing protein [Streptomyces sp. DT2A-34]MDO0913074.1 HEXXH motif domain-containing protein [Streptomyces sp. DT2A-34]
MAVDATTTGDRLPFHRLSTEGLGALARGDGDDAVVEELLGAERSRRLLLLRALDGGLPPHEELPVAYTEAWALLARVQRHAPDAFEHVLMSPGTGMWVSLAVRRLRGQVYEDAPLRVIVGHLAALAAAAGARAGLDFSITVPVRSGLVPLPTLGCAVLPETEQPEKEQWSTARVAGHGGRLRITAGHGEVEVAPGWDRRGPGWLPVRRVELGCGDHAKSLVLEELDPYRTFPRPSDPRPLSPAEAERWESLLARAWEVLRRDEPESARGMRRGLMSVAPTPARERFRPHSSTAGDAFGAVTASRPDDVAQLAATLVHEFQHTKLGGLMHLGPLLVPSSEDQPEELFYAPWRDDPRPLGGLLQGIYAFFGVTRFWRTHRHTADAAYAPLAHFEFALWRTQVWSTLNEVGGHQRLTPVGRRVLECLSERCASWMTDEVPAAELRLAEDVAQDHLARWRAHHLRPPAAAVEDAVQAWQRGDARPPATLAAEPELAPDTEVRFLDSAAVLARHRLSEPGGPWRHTAARYGADAGGVDGAEAADVLLACGDLAGARAACAARLTGKGAPVAAWVGLGRALSGDPAQAAASRLLLGFPERARAVQDALETATGRGADPVGLASWLARHPT